MGHTSRVPIVPSRVYDLHSGDTVEAARAVGISLGFSEDDIYGGVKPAGKDNVVAKLKVGRPSYALLSDCLTH